jgi:hypothetical protein
MNKKFSFLRFGAIGTPCDANASNNSLHWRESKNTRALDDSFIRIRMPNGTCERPQVNNGKYHGMRKLSTHSISRYMALQEEENNVIPIFLSIDGMSTFVPEKWIVTMGNGTQSQRESPNCPMVG